MSPPTVLVREATGDVPVVAPNLDAVCAFVGVAANETAADPALYARSEALFSIFDEGPGVRAAGHVIKKSRVPQVFCPTPASVDGSYGDVDLTGLTGTAKVSIDQTSPPLNDYEPYVVFPKGGTFGTSGIKLRVGVDKERNLGAVINLGTNYTYEIPGTGVVLQFDPPDDVLIAAATEARADTLAHLADVTAHDAADTSSAQVALAASAIPTTNDEAYAIMNLCRAAYAVHRINITAHNGQDAAQVISHAAATSPQTGIDLYSEYKTDWNLHLGIALAASTAGLKVATATVAAEVILTSADLLSAGLLLMASYARRLTFTTAGVTPAHAPANVVIVGTSYADAVISETLILSQIAGSVTSALAYKTITSITYPAADGTAATIAIGYGMGVHNSADITNTIAAAVPSHGTVAVNDVAWAIATGPKWVTDDLTAAGEKLAEHNLSFSMLYIAGPCSASDAAAVTTMLDALLGVGKRACAIIYARPQNIGESEADWIEALSDDYAEFFDDRIGVCAGTAWVQTQEGTKSRRYNTTFAYALMARLVKIDRFVSPGEVDLGPLEGVAIVNNSGKRIAHDENWIGGLDEARFMTLCRLPDDTRRDGSYLAHPYVMKAPDGRVSQFQVRRVLNAAERVASSVSFGELGQPGVYDPGTSMISETAADNFAKKISDPLSSEFGADISNPNDPELVQVDQSVTTSGDDMFLDVTVNLVPFKYVGGITLTFQLKI